MLATSSSTLTEHELGVELGKLVSTLTTVNGKTAGAGASSEEPWRSRLDALERLRVLAQEDLSSRPVFATQHGAPLRAALVDCLRDARTAVVRATCATIATLVQSSTNRTVCASVCVWTIPPLLALTASTTRVTVEAADDALQAMACSDGFGGEALGELLKGFHARHGAVRAHTATTLLAYMRRVKGTARQVAMDRFATLAARAIAAAVHDADERVRRAARCCFWGLHAMEPEAAARVWDGLDPPTRARLERDKAEALRCLGSAQGEESPPRMAASHDMTRARATEHRDVTADVGAGGPRSRSGDGRAGRTPKRSPQWTPLRAPSSQSTTPAPRGLAPAEWSMLQEELMSTDWRLRLEAIAALQSALPVLLDVKSGTSPGAAEAVEELTRRVRDPHVRVCLAALQCVGVSLLPHPMAAPALRTHAPALLHGLIVTGCHRKEAVARAAADVLQALLARLSLEVAVAGLLQCLDDVTTPGERCGTLRALQAFIEARAQDLADSAQAAVLLRGVVRQLHTVGAGRAASGGLEGPLAAEALRTLYRHAPAAVAAAVAPLGGDVQDLVRRILGGDARLAIANEPAAAGVSPACVQPHVPLLSDANAEGEGNEGQEKEEEGVPCTALPRQGRESAGKPAVRVAAAAPGPNEEADSHSPGQLTPPLPRRRMRSQLTHAAQTMRQSPPSPLQSQPQPPAYPLAKTNGVDLFPTAFAPSQWVGADEPRSAPFPVETAVVPPRRSPTGTRFAVALPQDRRLSDDGLLGAPVSVEPRDACGARAARLACLGSPDSTSDEVCAALDGLHADLLSHRERWPAESAAQLLATLLDHLCTESQQPQHTVRRRAFASLRVVLVVPAIRRVVARRLTRVLRAARCGLDDAFYEVQQEAARTAQTVLRECGLPTDLCLNGLAGVLEGWQRGPQRDDCTRGWLEVLAEVGRTLERVGAAGSVTEGVVGRVVRVVVWCLGHCAAEVRRTSVLVLVALWRSLGRSAYPFLAILDPVQRKLVSIYYNKARLTAAGAPRDDVEAAMQELLLAKAARRGSTPTVLRDLNEELRAAGFRDAPST